jgi:uncharacterized protein with GYD domain
LSLNTAPSANETIRVRDLRIPSAYFIDFGGFEWQSPSDFSTKEPYMPHYLIQAAYTPEAFQSLVRNPQNRTEVVRSAVEHMGGKLVGNWAAFGDYDTIVIVDMPSNVDAAAIAIAVAAGGSCKAIKTTPLLSTEEALEATKRAGTAGYKPVASAAAAK